MRALATAVGTTTTTKMSLIKHIFIGKLVLLQIVLTGKLQDRQLEKRSSEAS